MSRPIVEERFEYKGFPCVVLFQSLGFRTGYVGLPKGHKYYGAMYDLIPVDCHCGLTYGDYGLYGQEDKNTYWIGFDCGHCYDGYDLEKLDEYYKGEDNPLNNSILREYHKKVNQECEFRTLEYVKENCIQIVEQLLKEMEE